MLHERIKQASVEFLKSNEDSNGMAIGSLFP